MTTNNPVALSALVRPGAIVTQLWPAAPEEAGGTIRALEAIRGEDFFEAAMIAPVPDAGERRDVGAMVADGGPTLTYCLIPVMGEKGWNLSTGDGALRRRSVDSVLGLLDEAREVGAGAVMVGSGPAPSEPAERTAALGRLTESFDELCAAAATAGLQVVIEPLDVLVHKKQTLGYTPEAVALAQAMARHGAAMSLCLDTSHMTLNGEDIVDCLALAGSYADTLHFCNCVTDPGHPLYGDHHPPLGAPGYLDVPEMARLMAAAVRIGFFTPERRIEVCVEVFNHNAGDFEAGRAIMRAGRSALERAWAQAAAGAF